MSLAQLFLGNLSHCFLQNLSSSSGWMMRIGAQPFSERFSWVWALNWVTQGHSQTVLKPLLCYPDCVLSIVFLPKDEHPPQSDVQSALVQVIIKDVTAYRCIHLISTLTIILPPPCFTVGIVSARWWAVLVSSQHFAFKPKSSIFVSSDQRVLLSWSESSSGAEEMIVLLEGSPAWLWPF